MGIDVDVTIFEKSFLTVETLKESEDLIISSLKELVVSSVKKRIPNEKFGILFSGGIDSTLIALICKNLGMEFVCYTAALADSGLGEAQDLEWARRVAKELGFEHKIITLDLVETEDYLQKIVPLLKDPNVVNVGVALPEFLVCETAAKDGITSLFSGLGSEEIFAGYERHVNAKDANEECVNGLLMMPERDLERQIAVTNHNKVELFLPFLDRDLVKFSLGIPGKYKLGKINDRELTKVILRKTALDLGLNEEFALRKKTAAQYGSKFDRGIAKLANRKGLGKREYLEKLSFSK